MTDQSTPQISVLFATVATWAMEQGMPPRTFWEGQTEDWTVRINATKDMLEGVEPFHIHLEHRVYLAFAVLNAVGGALTGPSEDEVIAHFEARTSVDAWGGQTKPRLRAVIALEEESRIECSQ